MRHRDPRIRFLLQVLEQAFTAKGWQGATLSQAVRGVSPRQALWRPGPGRHNIWELVLHTAYWKHVVRQRVSGRDGEPARFPRSPRNYPALPARPDRAAWRDDVALMKREHALMLAVVRRLSPARLEARLGAARWNVAEQLHGVAAHDLYHTGQIQLLKALQRGRKR
jgi:uncharacterized damage-inducible protein DinB